VVDSIPMELASLVGIGLAAEYKSGWPVGKLRKAVAGLGLANPVPAVGLGPGPGHILGS
jgi:hypothetical protein